VTPTVSRRWLPARQIRRHDSITLGITRALPTGSSPLNPRDFDTVRSIYDAFARQDMETVQAALAADVVIDQPEALPWGGRYQGPDGFHAFLGAMLSRVQPTLEVGELLESGEHIVQVGRSRGRVRANDHDYEIREVHVWGFRDGKVASFTVHLDTATLTAALRAK
jgi:uncharacterized protein